jgi:hypothetical protein
VPRTNPRQAATTPTRRPAPQGPGGKPIRRNEGHGRGFVITLVLVLVVGGWILYSIARNAAENGVGFKGSTLELGSAAERAKNIKQTGPALFPALQGTTDIWVNRVGETWVAFAAAPAQESRECNTSWDAGRQRFQGPCGPETYPPNGEGLTQYFVTERDDILVVDFRTTLPGPGQAPVGELVTTTVK